VPEEKREELFFLIPKVDTLFLPEELDEFPGRREPSRSISVRGSTAQPHCLHESIVMVARERDQGWVALHSSTRGYSVARPCSGERPTSAPGRAGSRHEQPVAPTSKTCSRDAPNVCRRKRRALSVRNQIVNDRPCVLTVLLIRTVMRFATTR